MTKIHKSRSIFIKITITDATYIYMARRNRELIRDSRKEKKNERVKKRDIGKNESSIVINLKTRKKRESERVIVKKRRREEER